MPVLKPEEYDQSYFDGSMARYKHNAGYTEYKRWYRNDGVNSLGEFWKDYAKSLFEKHKLKGKKVLELGCAKGFIVKDLRDMGVDAYGLDVSSYAIENCEPEVARYLTVGDARSYLRNYKDKTFDVLFSLRFLECTPEADIPTLVGEMNRIAKTQFHVIDEVVKPDYYLNQPLKWWVQKGFAKNTVLNSQQDDNKELVK